MTEREMTAWLEAARTGRRADAWDALLAGLRDTFTRMLARRRVPHQLAEDVVQDALFLVWTRHGTVREPERFRSWATSVVLNRLRTAMTRRAQLLETGDLEDPVYECPAADDALLRSESLQWLRDRLDALEGEGDAIRLKIQGGLSSEQAGRLLGVSGRSFRRIVQRGLDRLRQQLKAEEAEMLSRVLLAS